MAAPLHHPSRAAAPAWRRWLGLSEVWVGGDLSSRLLLWLRWLAAAGQGATLWAVGRLGVEVPWAQCAAVVGVTLVSNAVLQWWLRQVDGRLGEGFFHVLLWDALSLTYLLYWTGGLQNPFALFYLVQLTLAAVSLRSGAVIGLGVIMAGQCALLLRFCQPLHMRAGAAVPAELAAVGFYTAIVLAGGFVLLMLLAIRRRSHRLQKERERLRAELAARDRFLSVAALATGFAHELATPLGTIALAAEELAADTPSATAQLIVREAQRCQEVLSRLRTLGQEATELSTTPCDVEPAVSSLLEDLPAPQRARVRLDLQVRTAQVACAGLREALLVLLRNALQSSAEDLPVTLRVSVEHETVVFRVEDSGPGFTPQMLQHWGEPFQTTRENGQGMGLGLFFVRRLAAALHGTVTVANRPAGGACVTLRLPQHPRPKPDSP